MEIDLEKYQKIPSEIFCLFKTNLPEEYKIGDSPVNIETSLNEQGLSEVIIL